MLRLDYHKIVDEVIKMTNTEHEGILHIYRIVYYFNYLLSEFGHNFLECIVEDGRYYVLYKTFNIIEGDWTNLNEITNELYDFYDSISLKYKIDYLNLD